MDRDLHILFRLCAVSAEATALNRASARAWQQYLVDKEMCRFRAIHDCDDLAEDDGVLPDSGVDWHAGNPFANMPADMSVKDPQYWFRVGADIPYFVEYYGTEIGDPYDPDAKVNCLKSLYLKEIKPRVERELGAKIAIEG